MKGGAAMTSHLQKKREAIIAKLHAEVGVEKLAACMMFVFQKRRERAGQNPDFRLGGEQVEPMLEDFLQTCSMQQLRKLCKIADLIPSEVVTDPQELKEIRAAGKDKVEVITEVVKPPMEH
jgi:hypothetical protein